VRWKETEEPNADALASQSCDFRNFPDMPHIRTCRIFLLVSFILFVIRRITNLLFLTVFTTSYMARTQQNAKKSVGGRAPRRKSVQEADIRSTLRKSAVTSSEDLPPAPVWDRGDLTPLREESPEPEANPESNIVEFYFIRSHLC
jgi:hypothetical protein